MVIQNILKRREEIGAAVSPERKFGLVIEGGAMRGIISGGALLALSELGLLSVFDEIYGSSAGAINAAYALAGQSGYGLTIYYEDINNRTFINLARLSRIVDLDYLFDEIIARRKPLNVSRVRASRTRLHVSVTDAETGEGRFFDNHAPDLDLLKVLKAGAAMPVLYNRPVQVQGRAYLDGGIADSIPVEKAVSDGCTDVLVLLTRPAGYRKSPPGPLARLVETEALRKFGRGFVRAHFNRYKNYNRSLDIAFGRIPPARPVNISVICPDRNDKKVGRITTDAARLKEVAGESIRRTGRRFGHDPQVLEVLKPFDLKPGSP